MTSHVLQGVKKDKIRGLEGDAHRITLGSTEFG